MKKGMIWFVILMMLGFFSCSGDDDDNDQGQTLSGTWTGIWISHTATQGSLTATLTQTGSSFSGTCVFTNSPCFDAGTISGYLGQDNSLIATFMYNDQQAVQLVATVSASLDEIGGSYNVVLSGDCYGDYGSWTLTK